MGRNMAELSVSAAAGAGFKLIGRKPLTVIFWGIFYILVGVVPIFALMGPYFMSIGQLMHQVALNPGTPPSPDTLNAMRGQMMLNPAINLLSLVVRTVMCAAVYRAVLEPRKSSFAYLRLGMQEVWIFLVTVVEVILVAVGMIIAIILTAVIAGVMGSAVSKPAGVLTGVVLGLVIFIGLIWVLLRLSMATPMSFADRQFRLFESWRVTRGHAGQLLLLVLLMIVIAIGLEMVFFAVFGVIAFAALGPVFANHPAGLSSHQAAMAFFQQDPQVWLRAAAPFIIGFVVLMALLIGPLQAIFIAPWAAAYRMLRPEGQGSSGGLAQPLVLGDV
jgi:hypothetical protein